MSAHGAPRILAAVNGTASQPHSAHWLLLALLGAYLWLAASQLDAPLNWDEVNFYWNAEAIAQFGVPYANAGFLADRGTIGAQYQYGLWHPPLYLYTLGLAFKLLGASEAVARGTGVTLMLLTAITVYLLARLTIPPPARDWGALLAAAIFLLSPLVVQSALVLDIDGTVLTLLLTVWSLLYLRCEMLAPRWQAWALGLLTLAFALTLWAKLTTPFFLLGVVLVYQTLRGRPGRALLHVLVIGVGGMALFLNTWGLVCDQLGLPFEMPFGVTWAELHDAVGSDGATDLLERIEPQALPVLAWVSPYLAALGVGALVARAAALVRQRRLETVDFLLGMGLLVGIIYFVKLAAGFPKYHIAMMPFWAVALAHWVATSWVRLPRLAGPALFLLVAAALGIAFSYSFIYIADSWMFEPRTLEQVDGLGLGLLAAYFLAVVAWPRTTTLAAPLAAGTLALYFGWALSADWYHSWVPYSTNYWYGSRGQREIAAVVDDLLVRYEIQGPYIGAKEAVFYTRNHFFVDQDTVYWLWGDRGEGFDGVLLGYDIPLVVAWVREPWVRHIFEERLGAAYEPVAQAHDYLVYLRRSPALGTAEDADAAASEATPAGDGGPPVADGSPSILTRLAADGP